MSSAAPDRPAAVRPVFRALWRGFRERCPRCDRGAVFRRYLKVDNHCGHCGEALHHHRADDAPPYVTILVVGHIVIPLVLLAERHWAPPTLVHWMLWLPLSLALTAVLLPRIKGALVALQWACRMHGFGESEAGDLQR